MMGWMIALGYLCACGLATRYLFHSLMRKEIYRHAKRYGSLDAESIDKGVFAFMAVLMGAIWPVSLPAREIYIRVVENNETYSNANMNKIIEEIRKNDL